MSAGERSALRLAAHLASEAAPGRCELVGNGMHGRCDGPVVAVRWEDGFADFVCEEHAARAERRDALVVRCQKHDGSVG